MKKIILAAAMALSLVACNTSGRQEVKPVKNVIVFITDGTSIGVLSTARWYQRYMTEDLTWDLCTDPYLCGVVTSQLSDAIIPDSAPAMSGYMTGVPQRAGNISIYPVPHEGQDVVKTDPERALQPAATLLEAAKVDRKKSTGVVATVIFPHATPAATSSHSASRSRYSDLGLQMASQDLNVVFAGGVGRVTPEIRETLEGFGTPLLENNIQAFRDFSGDKVWALWGQENMAYEVDRQDDEEPSLTEMTTKAIEVLSKNKNGFFLMVEGSKVDYAAHSNDPYTTITEFLEFDRAVGAAIEFAKKDGNTAVVILPDHGTSGLTLGDKYYRNYSSKGLDSMFINMKNYKISADRLTDLVTNCEDDQVTSVFREWTGIELNAKEMEAVMKGRGTKKGYYTDVANFYNLQSEICKIMTNHTHIGFTSGNHTGEDVFLAVYNPNGQIPQGKLVNTELNEYIAKLIGIKRPMVEISDECFAKYTDVFAGCECSIEKAEKANPVLVVKKDGKVLSIPAFKSAATLEANGSQTVVSTITPAVYMKENDTFYVHTSLSKAL